MSTAIEPVKEFRVSMTAQGWWFAWELGRKILAPFTATVDDVRQMLIGVNYRRGRPTGYLNGYRSLIQMSRGDWENQYEWVTVGTLESCFCIGVIDVCPKHVDGPWDISFVDVSEGIAE